MNSNTSSSAKPPTAGGANPIILTGAGFVLGAVLAGAWFLHRPASSTKVALDAATEGVLTQLPGPVTIHYFALLPSGSADPNLQAFAGRVSDLLDEMQTASGGKLTVTAVNDPSEANDNAAGAEGVQPFNLDKGAACYLGLTVAGSKNKEAFAHLQPEWEPALQDDLAQAIARVTAAPAPAPVRPEVAQPSAEVTGAIQRLVPDVNATSPDDADKIFQNDYLAQVLVVGQETEAAIEKAKDQVVQAQGGGSPTDLQAAQKNLKLAELAQVEKFRHLTALLQTEKDVFRRMKDGAK